MGYNYNFNSELNKSRIQKILSLCKEQPTCAYDIADAIGLRLDGVNVFTRHLLALKWIHISDYRIVNQNWRRYYSLGNKESVNKYDYVEKYYMTAKQRKAIADGKRYRKKNPRVIKNIKIKEPITVVPKKIQPDIHSAWLFNPILK